MIKFQKILRFIPFLNLVTLFFLGIAFMRDGDRSKLLRVYIKLLLPFAVICIIRALIMNNFEGLAYDIATTALLFLGMYIMSFSAVSIQERYF